MKVERILEIEVKGFGVHFFTPIVESVRRFFGGRVTRKPREADVVRLEIRYGEYKQTLNLTMGDKIRFDRTIKIDVK